LIRRVIVSSGFQLLDCFEAGSGAEALSKWLSTVIACGLVGKFLLELPLVLRRGILPR
jgi:hypothetical protein